FGFIGACAGGHTHLVEECRHVLKCDPDNCTCTHDCSFFYLLGFEYACKFNHVHIASLLIDTIDDPDNSFEHACKNGNMDLIKMIYNKWPTVIDNEHVLNYCNDLTVFHFIYDH